MFSRNSLIQSRIFGCCGRSLLICIFLRYSFFAIYKSIFEYNWRMNGVWSGEGEVSETERALLAPYAYICQAPGKHIRTKLASAFNVWLQIPDAQMAAIAEIVQMLHNASLMIDDIEDNSILRRSLPVAHSIYGVPRTINAANYVYFLALQKCLQLKHPMATAVFSEQLLELHRGQGKEIYWRDTVTCPTFEEYEKMVKQKTGALFGLAVRLMQLFSTNEANFTPLIDTLGLLFQIRDDYANLCSSEYAEKKSYAEDLTEGKFSYPIIHAITADPTDGQVVNILRQKPTGFEVKRYCVELLEKAGSFEYTRSVLQSLDQRVMEEVNKLGGNEHFLHVLSELRPLYMPQN